MKSTLCSNDYLNLNLDIGWINVCTKYAILSYERGNFLKNLKMENIKWLYSSQKLHLKSRFLINLVQIIVHILFTDLTGFWVFEIGDSVCWTHVGLNISLFWTKTISICFINIIFDIQHHFFALNIQRYKVHQTIIFD